MNLWFWLFAFSCVIIAGLIYYVFWLVRYISQTNEDLKSMSFNFKQFEEHLSTIYEMEMFYGDETLKSLLSHTKEIKDTIEEFQIIIDQSSTQSDTNNNSVEDAPE